MEKFGSALWLQETDMCWSTSDFLIKRYLMQIVSKLFKIYPTGLVTITLHETMKMSTKKTDPLNDQERNVWKEEHQKDSLVTALCLCSSTKKSCNKNCCLYPMTFNEVHCSFTIMIAHNLSKGKAMCQKHIQFNRHMLDIRDYSHIKE